MRATIRLKLAASFGLVLLLCMMTGAVATSKLATLNATLDSVVNGTARRSLEASQFQIGLLEDLHAEKRNAAASEQMSATAEELAAQSEQLQSNIEYFRLDEAKTPAIHTPARQVRATAHTPPAKRQPPRLETSASRAATPQVVRKPQSPPAAKGFALALTDGGADERDHDFERY